MSYGKNANSCRGMCAVSSLLFNYCFNIALIALNSRLESKPYWSRRSKAKITFCSFLGLSGCGMCNREKEKWILNLFEFRMLVFSFLRHKRWMLWDCRTRLLIEFRPRLQLYEYFSYAENPLGIIPAFNIFLGTARDVQQHLIPMPVAHTLLSN